MTMQIPFNTNSTLPSHLDEEPRRLSNASTCTQKVIRIISPILTGSISLLFARIRQLCPQKNSLKKEDLSL